MDFDSVYDELLDIVTTFGVDVDAPLESREFFEQVVANFFGTREELLTYIRINMPTWFRSVSERPDWLQSSDWQFSNGRPMIFIGQIDVLPNSGLFHDQARFFIFWHPEWDETKTVLQVA